MTSGINHQVGMKAAPEEIYRALTDVTTLAKWWTTDTRGNGASVGDTLEFWFGTFCQQFIVTALEPGRRVAWRSPEGQGSDEWQGTEVTFDLSRDEKQTFVQFRHSGWRESTNFQGHCSMRWAVFLLSLRDVVERGKGRPVPFDYEVHYR
ncbi:MAG TPA: SRPBCC domain-containing protein [Polyangiaceae bacterium]|nr:SRPBCC domain-containing protein [Polyangiaceae bacterium]